MKTLITNDNNYNFKKMVPLLGLRMRIKIVITKLLIKNTTAQ